MWRGLEPGKVKANRALDMKFVRNLHNMAVARNKSLEAHHYVSPALVAWPVASFWVESRRSDAIIGAWLRAMGAPSGSFPVRHRLSDAAESLAVHHETIIG